MQSVGTRWGWRRARNNSRCASSGCLGSFPPSCGGEARSVESTPGAAEVSTRHTTAPPDVPDCAVRRQRRGSVASLRPAPRVYSMSEVLCMRTSLCFLLLAIGGLPLAAQPDRRMFPARNFPPEIISQDELPRDIVRVASARQVRVDFENDRTRVLRLTLAAGETISTHDDRAGVLVDRKSTRLNS